MEGEKEEGMEGGDGGRDGEGWRKEGWGGIEKGGMGRDAWSGVEERREGEQSSLT